MEEMRAGIEGILVGQYGYNRFLSNLNLPGFPGFGIIEIGEVWKGPRLSSMVSREYGPSHRPVLISFLITSWKAVIDWVLLSLSGGENV